MLADCHVKLESPHEAATSLFDGANALKKSSPAAAVDLLKQAAELYMNMGRLSMAAKNFREVAELLEKAEDKAGAVDFYEQAKDMYETEEMRAESNKCKPSWPRWRRSWATTASPWRCGRRWRRRR